MGLRFRGFKIERVAAYRNIAPSGNTPYSMVSSAVRGFLVPSLEAGLHRKESSGSYSLVVIQLLGLFAFLARSGFNILSIYAWLQERRFVRTDYSNSCCICLNHLRDCLCLVRVRSFSMHAGCHFGRQSSACEYAL